MNKCHESESNGDWQLEWPRITNSGVLPISLRGKDMFIQRVFNKQCLLGFTALFIFASQGLAQDEDGFSGRAGLGLLATSGNSESDSLNANFDLWWNSTDWGHSLKGGAIKSSASGTNTGEAYGLGWQSKYNFSDTDYIFGLIAWDKDEFSAYEQQLREVIGYGRRILDTETQYLGGEIGVGARQSDLVDGSSQDETIGYLGAEYRLTISESSHFSQLLSVETGSDNTYIEATSSLSSNIRESLALILAFTVKNNSDVLPGTEKTDTLTTISLEYGF